MLIGLAEQTLLAALGQAAVYAHSTPPPNIQSPLEEMSFCSLDLETFCSMHFDNVESLLCICSSKINVLEKTSLLGITFKLEVSISLTVCEVKSNSITSTIM